ncbi:type 1 glutamine amidotransferase [Thiomicrorhabdus sp.]|uniref:type 1 glutamine amidotransferase n=1 Tax=Thiomicrorhabdus sp. TaxID=2039724 RepID=UPI002AA7DBC4|nr:type 1 glutamine amidotransferase [Thiomicrorhabdus sp.]
MKVLIVKHAVFEKEGNMAAWLQKKQADVVYLNLYESTVFPDPKTFDLIVLLGGPMSVNDEEEYPWLVAEKRFVKEALLLDMPILGICLGGQLIANALGAPVTLNKETEIGWHTISNSTSNSTSNKRIFQFPEQMPIFNWHGETFALPTGAESIMKSQACENQGFQYGGKVIGLQCHPEVTPEIIQDWIDEIGEQMVQGEFVHTPEQMFVDVENKVAQAQIQLENMLDFITIKK